MQKVELAHVASREFKVPRVTLVIEDPKVHVVVVPPDPRDHKEFRVQREKEEPLDQEQEDLLGQWALEESVERWGSKVRRAILVHLEAKVLLGAMGSRVTVVLLVQWAELVCVALREIREKKA